MFLCCFASLCSECRRDTSADVVSNFLHPVILDSSTRTDLQMLSGTNVFAARSLKRELTGSGMFLNIFYMFEKMHVSLLIPQLNTN